MSDEHTEIHKEQRLEILSGRSSQSNVKKYNWKKTFFLTLLGLLVFFGIRSVDKIKNKISPFKNENSPKDSALVGHYNCSTYDHDRALELKPKISKKRLERDELNLKLKKDALLRLESKMKVLRKSNVTGFNKAVGHHNAELAIFNREYEELKSLRDQFNDQVNKHNDYLIKNCIYAGNVKELEENND